MGPRADRAPGARRSTARCALGAARAVRAAGGDRRRCTPSERATGRRSPRSTASWRALTGSPVVELNRAVAVAEAARGRRRRSRCVERLELDGYHYLHATRAELLRRGSDGGGARRLRARARARARRRRASISAAAPGGARRDDGLRWPRDGAVAPAASAAEQGAEHAARALPAAASERRQRARAAARRAGARRCARPCARRRPGRASPRRS